MELSFIHLHPVFRSALKQFPEFINYKKILRFSFFGLFFFWSSSFNLINVIGKKYLRARKRTNNASEGKMNQTSDFGWHFINFHYRRGIREGSRSNVSYSPPSFTTATDSCLSYDVDVFNDFFSCWVSIEFKQPSERINVIPKITGAKICKQVKAWTEFRPPTQQPPACFPRIYLNVVSLLFKVRTLKFDTLTFLPDNEYCGRLWWFDKKKVLLFV